jgi:membrane protease YdiL (CAAX protease family)
MLNEKMDVIKQNYISNFPKYLGLAVLMIVINMGFSFIVDLSSVETVDVLGEIDMMFIVLILPVSLLVEEFITRGLVYRLTKGTLSNKVAYISILYFMAMLHTILHYSNLVNPSTLDLLRYFSVQFVGGLFLGIVILKYGFKGSYTVHVLYDYILIFASIFLSNYIQVI